MDSYIVIAGDLFPSSGNVKKFISGDSETLFGKQVCELFGNADFSIVNLEGALTDSKSKQDKVPPIISASPQSIHAIKNLIGKGVLSLANNHVTDYGEDGFSDTIDAISNAGLMYLGAGLSEDAIQHSMSVDIAGRKVAIYVVSEIFFNQPGKLKAGVHTYDEYIVCKEISELKKKHDYVIVIYHGGAERFPYPTPLVRKRFHRMAESGADFITAQHTHCIGCAEWYSGSYLLYGQGNFLFSRMKQPYARQGLVTEIIFSSDVLIKQHWVKVLDDETLCYDNVAGLSDFESRSNTILQDGQIDRLYQGYIKDNTKLKFDYLSAYRGETMDKALMMRLFPRLYKERLWKKYKKDQLLRILLSLQSDRTRENVLNMWLQLFEQYKS